jgi:predicted Fe-S protein YdhL (DUF1289 family)
MTRERVFHFVDIRGVRCTIDRDAGTCPLCHRAVHAEQVDWALVPPAERHDPILEIVYRCPHHQCGRHFIGRFKLEMSKDYRGLTEGQFKLWSTTPWNPEEPPVPQEVSQISPLFVEVYAQAAAAEAFRLPQVAGPGYRKALEFLVKDYSASLAPEKAEAIRASPLGQVISDHVDDANVRACAQRAAWLGNDETHYVRKWESKDIEDLKTLLQLTVNWIHNHKLTQKYLKDMAP